MNDPVREHAPRAAAMPDDAVSSAPVAVALLSLPPRSHALLAFFFAHAGRGSFVEVGEDEAEAALFDLEAPDSREHWLRFTTRARRPGLAMAVQEQAVDGAAWLRKPVTPVALLAAAAPLRAAVAGARAIATADAGARAGAAVPADRGCDEAVDGPVDDAWPFPDPLPDPLPDGDRAIGPPDDRTGSDPAVTIRAVVRLALGDTARADPAGMPGPAAAGGVVAVAAAEPAVVVATAVATAPVDGATVAAVHPDPTPSLRARARRGWSSLLSRWRAADAAGERRAAATAAALPVTGPSPVVVAPPSAEPAGPVVETAGPARLAGPAVGADPSDFAGPADTTGLARIAEAAEAAGTADPVGPEPTPGPTPGPQAGPAVTDEPDSGALAFDARVDDSTTAAASPPPRLAAPAPDAAWFGIRADVGPAELADDPQRRYDPEAHLCGVLREAWRVGIKWQVPTRIDTPAGPIVLDASRNALHAGFDPAALVDLARHPLPARPKVLTLTDEACAEFVATHGATAAARRLDAELWLAALHAGAGRLPADLDPRRVTWLRHWPNLTRLPAIPHAPRLAALWALRGASVVDAARTLKVPQREVIAFANACWALNLLTDDGSHLRRAQRRATRHRGLLGRLLGWLRT